jgi:hypothetical protein
MVGIGGEGTGGAVDGTEEVFGNADVAGAGAEVVGATERQLTLKMSTALKKVRNKKTAQAHGLLVTSSYYINTTFIQAYDTHLRHLQKTPNQHLASEAKWLQDLEKN